MKIKTILLFCFILTSNLVYAQADEAIKLTLVSPACKGICNGRINVEVGAKVVVPLTVTVSNGAGTSRVFTNIVQSFVVQDLCSGSWSVSATPERIENCAPIVETIEVPSIEVKVQTTAINNPTGGQNNGSISVQGFAQNSQGVVYDHTYTYAWSNGSTSQNVQGLGVGSYTVVVTDVQAGCQATGNFNLSACDPNAPPFDILIEGGIISQQEGNSIPMSVSLRPSPNAPWGPVPQGYAIEWSFGGQLINAPSLALPINSAPIEVTVKVTDACGRIKTATRKAISCSETPPTSYANIDVKDYFVSELVLPCMGESDGAAILKFWAPDSGLSELSFEYEPNAEIPEVIFRKGANPEIGTDGIGENMYQVNIPSLKGGKTYYISGFLGNKCKVKFSFTLAEQETEKICAGYDKKTNTCLYDEECNGEIVEPRKNFKSPAYTLNSLETVRQWGENGLFPKCQKDLFCFCNGNDEKKEDGNEGWVTTRIGEYWEVLQNHSRNTGIDFFTGSSTVGRSPCAHVKYCSLDPTVIWGTFNYAEKEARGSRNPVVIDGKQCLEFKCVALGFIKSKFTACVVNVPPPLPPKGSRDCQVTTENLLQMVIWHQNGKLNTLWPGPDDKLTYADSKLENLLDDYTNLADKKLRCATVSFCKNDLNGYVATNESAGLCGDLINIELKYTAETCEVASLNLGNGEWFGDSYNQAYRENLFVNSGLVEKAIFYCNNGNNASQYSAVNFYSNPVFLLPENQEAPQTFDSPHYDELVSSSLLTPEEEESERLQVIIQDTFLQEKLLNFGELTFENHRIPKGIIKTDSSRVFGDYIFGDQKFLKQPAHKLVHQYANWDTETNLFMEETEPKRKYAFEYSDTLKQYQGRLESSTFLQTRICVPQDTGLIITGLMSGNLSLDSTSIAYTDDLAAFYLKISRNGQPMAFQLIEKIDTTQGIQFSENRSGKVIVSGGYAEGVLTINGQSHSLSNAQGVFVAQMNELNTTIIQEIGGNAPVNLKGIAYDADTSQIGLLINGIDSVWHAGASLTATAGNQVSVISLSTQGVLKWAKKIATPTIELNKVAFSNGNRKGLFLGLTYRDSLKFYGHKLQSKGQEDIAILKFDTSGVLVQIDTFGTPDGETVSQMMLSENVLFFGGEMNGPTKTRTIGLMDFINTTTFDDRVYISAVTDTLGANLPFPDTNVVAEILQIPAQNEHKVAKKLQRSVAMFAFPNPVQDELTLQFQAEGAEIWKLQLVDNLGSVVKQISQQVNPGFNSTKLSTASLAPGMYFLQCVAPDGYIMQTVKVIKTR
ncbi:T9SS type A sorting domain-containing protein [Haliscomenobacter hydrossis]|nr:T9SS type A sorting domain-containing protein [Haliscomenobacter hydrossis]